MHLRAPTGEFSLRLLSTVSSQGALEPDLQVQVNAKVAKFEVQAAGAWLEWPAVQAFIQQLEKVVRTCKGEAVFGAMSPTDLQLSIQSADSLGHFALRFTVGEVVHSRVGLFQHSLSGGFELELSQVEELLAWFKSPPLGESDA